MAVPTIVSVSPNSGRARGYNVVRITGTNFRTRSVSYAIPLVSLDPPVSVTVGGRAARAVRVLSATALDILVPEYRGAIYSTGDSFPASDVVVSNLDDSGLVIPGETVTLADGYTYQRATIRLPSGDPPFLRVMRQLIRMLGHTVTPEVGWLASTDYGEDGETVGVVQTHPSIGIRMDAMPDPEYGHVQNNVHQYKVRPGDDGWDRYRPPEVYMLVFDLVLSSQNPVEAHHMLAEVLQLWKDNQELEVDGDPDWSSGTNKYPLEMPQRGTQISDPNDREVVAFGCQMRVRGIPVLSDEPVEQVYEIGTVIMAYMQMGGSTAETFELP